ncbi:MAG TPA: DUF3298 domain-containing protein [bacterium]|nr:DUF3298 domain-containing protein [bacterium]
MRRRGRFAAGLAVLAASVLLCSAEAAQAPLRFAMVTTKQSGPHWSTTVVYPRFDGGSPLAALANHTLATREVAAAVTFGLTAAEQFKKLGPPTADYFHDAGATVSLTDPALLSAYFETEEYSGGAHPNRYYTGYTFGIVRGRPAPVTLQDLFRPGVDGAKTASDLLIARLRQNPNATFVRDGTVTSIEFNGVAGSQPVGATAFVVTPRAIVFLLPPYAVGAYVDGSFVVKIPFDAFGGRLDPAGPLQPVLP